MTGKTLTLWYIYPCLEEKLRNNEVSDAYFVEATRLIKAKEEPTETFLRICAPKAIHAQCEYARRRKKDPWAEESAREFWRYHHGGTTPAWRGKIVNVVTKTNMEAAQVIPDHHAGPEQKALRILNLYGHCLRVGNYVFSHHGAIIEVEGAAI